MVMRDQDNLPQAAGLTALFRQLDREGLPAWLDGELLAAHAEGKLPEALAERVQAELLASPPLNALYRSLVELSPDAEHLAAALGTAGHARHRRTHAAARHVAHRTTARRPLAGWVGMAAVMLLSVAAVWGARQLQVLDLSGAAMMATGAGADAIFGAGMDGDEIFDGSMDGGMRVMSAPADDRIFGNGFRHKSS